MPAAASALAAASIAAPRATCDAAILLHTGESDALRQHSSLMRTIRILATQSTKMNRPENLVYDEIRSHKPDPHDSRPQKTGKREHKSNDRKRPDSPK